MIGPAVIPQIIVAAKQCIKQNHSHNDQADILARKSLAFIFEAGQKDFGPFIDKSQKKIEKQHNADHPQQGANGVFQLDTQKIF